MFLSENFMSITTSVNAIYRIFRWYQLNGSATAWLRLFTHYVQRTLGKSVPPFILIAPTYRCQCHCIHCAVDSSQTGEKYEMTTAPIKSVIDQAKELGVIQVVFTGGEPLMREDITELVAHAHEAGLITRVITNGLLLNRALVKDLKKAGLTQCSVSIDDADPEIHDRLRGFPGLFKQAIEGIKNLSDFNILCQIHTYAAKRNIPDGLERIIELGKQLHVFSVCISFPIALGRWRQKFDQVLNEEERKQVRRLQDLTFVHVELPTHKAQCRVAQKSFLFVSPHGNVTPCPFVPYPFGNIHEISLSDLWKQHSEALNFEYRGECPMNSIKQRNVLKRHVKRIACQQTSVDGK